MSLTARNTHSALTTSGKSRRWNREYLPGYTGFVPTKNNFFGKTSGSINREVSLTGGNPRELDLLELSKHKAQNTDLPASKEINKDVYSNLSKNSVNWVSGPTHMVRQQMVPRYTGHCRGLVNKDFMPKSYAKVTAELYSR
jgi:organic radical activating enzyme